MIDIPSYDWKNVESPWISVKMDTWRQLIEGRIPYKYSAKTDIYWQDKDFSDFYIVASGRICVSIFHQNGSQTHLYIACPGAIIGEISCILSRPHMTTATAIVDSELYRIPSKEVQYWFHQDHILADLLLQYLARINSLLTAHIAMLSFDRAEQRIAKILLYQCEHHGIEVSDGICISQRFTCSDVASLANTSRVTVNNVMLNFTHAGIICKRNSHYILKDPDQLQKIAAQFIEN